MKTAVEWLVDEIKIQQQMYIDLAKKNKSLKKEVDAILTASTLIIMKSGLAKEMEKEQTAYSKEDVLKAGEMGEINHLDTKHIVSYLDEAKQYNETFKQQEI